MSFRSWFRRTTTHPGDEALLDAYGLALADAVRAAIRHGFGIDVSPHAFGLEGDALRYVADMLPAPSPDDLAQSITNARAELERIVADPSPIVLRAFDRELQRRLTHEELARSLPSFAIAGLRDLRERVPCESQGLPGAVSKEPQGEQRERLVALGTMVAGFAHEIRNPVAALRSITEELAEELTAAGLDLPHAKRMLQVLERMERLVRTSLQFGRPAAPRRAAHRPWAVCSAALDGIASRTNPGVGEVRVVLEEGLPDVFVDDAHIVQALLILLDNALDAASSPRAVLVRVTRAASSDEVRFAVSDDGPGIAPATLAQIFDPFFTTKPSGTGLVCRSRNKSCVRTAVGSK